MGGAGLGSTTYAYDGIGRQTAVTEAAASASEAVTIVEQRIGRLDRIGGKPIIDISNYFYENTVEEQVYRGIGEDVDWFEDVVGPAQPVLSQIEKAIEEVAMEAPGPSRQRDVAAKISQIRASIEASKAEALNLTDLDRDPGTHWPPRETAIRSTALSAS